jgi:hypothetical protein
MAGYSWLAKNYEKNFTTCECKHRRNHQYSSIVVRSSDSTVKHYFRSFSIQHEHIHESTRDNMNIRKLKQRVRERCRKESSSRPTIFQDELLGEKY